MSGREAWIWGNERERAMYKRNMKKITVLSQVIIRRVLLSLALFASNLSIAASLESIDFKALDGDQFEVLLQMDTERFQEPQIFVIEQPARLVMDLPGVTNQVAQKKFALSLDNTDEAMLLGTTERTRLVINLKKSANYQTNIQGSSVRLIVGSDQGSQSSDLVQSEFSAVQQAYEKPAGENNLVKILDLDFRRGPAGEGNLIFEFDNDDLNTDVSLEGSRIVVRFFGTQLEEKIERIFDVQDFATPVTSFSAQNTGEESRIEIETSDAFDYLAYQTDTSYVISVKPIEKDSAGGVADEFAFVGEKISLNFQDIEIRAVLQLIADFTELNLVASDTVGGSITLRLQNVPWDQALEIVLKAKGLDQRREGNVLLVAPIAEIAERERLEVEASKQLEELAPLITEYLRIRYADAVELYNLLGSSGSSSGDGEESNGGLLSSRGTAIVDSRTNTIILTDTADKVANFEGLIEQLDIPIRQVLIEARIVVANSDFRKELGVRWGGMGVRSLQQGEGLVQYGADVRTVQGEAASFFNGNDFDDFPLAVDLGVAAPTSSFAVSYLTDSAFVELELSALENEGFGEVISQPKVLTGDKQTAYIKSGSEVAYQEAASSGATTTAFKEAVLQLSVTPQITPDDRVILDINVQQDSIGALVFGGEPTIDITELETQVLVDNGETLILGGIFQMTTTDDVDKVPVLGDLPLIGRAFKNTVKSQEKQEVLIFITPKILSEDYGAR